MPHLRLSKSLRARLIVSYGKDWVLVILMIIIFFAIDIITPFHREFSINDTSLMHNYAVNESVPVWALAVIAIVAPVVIIAVISIGVRRSWMDFNSGLLGLALALSMTIMFTDVLKITVGRPRPDMLDRCQPPPGIQDPPLHLLNYTICTADHNTYEFKDGFKSFPSGHASFSFAGLGYLSFFLAGKMHLFDQGGHTYKSFVFSFPFLGALLIAISRIRDYRHHWTDVFVGGIIGTVFAYFCYRQYYPSLAHKESQKPFPPRLSSPEDIFPGDNPHHDDEESAVVHPGDSFYGECRDSFDSSSRLLS
ncbi:phosphatidic acid phosphatase type 2/haloperoxidase [Gilbertella persicaria]|uniref:phosphatidic acid phosphatase type 2/haloperoxidase n=1 Tax=Gilbertella persicaria TaxID=101096 RepID=UPI0022212A9E|nr:phosphatidic acid phosphatase type 2/haloperoxidase [Gilbertella persicaria]KAI8082543.1 phosphatidic acid phosphatase type 2/haloperoxidase [Gilbertella persicaria]